MGREVVSLVDAKTCCQYGGV